MAGKVLCVGGLVIFGTLLVMHPAAQSFERNINKEDYIYEEVLPNGLTLLVRENHSAPIAQVSVYVKTGSIYEDEYLGCGISHHIEHIVSGGSTSKKTEAEYQETTSLLGGACNAWTSTDHTCYYISSSAENLHVMLDVLSDWVFDCIFAEEEFAREHGVIQREIEMGMQESVRRLWKLTMKTMFKVHPVRYPTIGYLENFLPLTREDLVGYYNRWYVPENTVVVIVGDVETRTAAELVRETFGLYPRRPAALVTLPEEPPQLATRVGEEEMDVEITYLRLAYQTIPVTHPDLYPLDLLSYILTRGESALLVKKIRDELGLVSSISSYSATPGYEAGHFAITSELDPEKCAEAERAILLEMENLKRTKFDRSLLEKAKKQKITEYVFDNQTIAQQSRMIAWSYLSTHDPYFYSRYVEEIQQVTAEDIQRVLNHYFAPENLTIARIAPRGEASSEMETVERPVPHEIEKSILQNGMTLLSKIDGSIPLITLLAVWKGGVLYEAEENNGVSKFTVEMLSKGTDALSAADISDKIDNMGIQMTSVGGNNALYLGFNLVSSDFDEALDVFADIIQHPAFRPEEIERMRERLSTEVARSEGDWFFEAASFLRQNLFIDHPYRLVPEGTRESLAHISREDLLQFHRSFCRPDNMVLAIFGDIAGLEVEKKVDELFGDWRALTPLNLPVNEPEARLTEKKRAKKYTQKDLAVICMGYPGMTVDNLEDRYPMEVLDAVVSGIRYGTGSWLHTALRGNELVYVVHAYNWMGLDPGYFFVYAATAPDKVEQAIELTLEQIERIKVEDIPDDEFERAKGTCVTIEKLDHESNHDQALRSALDELYGLGYDFYKEHEKRIQAVTEDDVRRVASKYLNNYVLITTVPEAGGEYSE